MRRISLAKSIFVLITALLIAPAPVIAAPGEGQVGASILDPRTMDKDAATELCKKAQHAVKCDYIVEESNFVARAANSFADPLPDEFKRDPFNYRIFNANFE